MAKNINVVLTLQNRFSKGMTDAKYKTQEFRVALAAAQSVSDTFAGVMKKMETAAITATTAAATAAIGLSKQALDAYKEFNTVANEVAGIRGIDAQSEAYARLTDNVKEAVKQVKGLTYAQGMEADKYMSLAGWTEEQQNKARVPLLKALRISGTEDTQTVMDAITDSMTALGLESSQADRYVDVVTAIQSAANTNTLELQNALINAGPSMKNLYEGSSAEENFKIFENTGTIIGALGSAGIKDGEAGTVIGSLVTRWVKNGVRREAQKGFEQIGMDVYDENRQLKSPDVLFGELLTRTKGLRAEDRNSALSLIGGAYHSELITLIDAFNESGEDGITQINKIKNAIEHSEGAADRFVEAVNSGYSGALQQMTTDWYNFKIDVGEVIAPYAIEGMQYVIDNLPTIEAYLVEKIPSAAERMKEIFGEMKPVIEDIKSVAKYIIDNRENIAKILGGAYIGMGAFRIGTAGMQTYANVKSLQGLFGRMSMAKNNLKGADVGKTVETVIDAASGGAKVGTVVGGGATLGGFATVAVTVAAIAGGIYLAYKNSEKFRDSVKNVGEKLGEIKDTVGEALSGAFEKVQPLAESVWGLIENVFGAVGDVAGTLLEWSVDRFIEDINNIITLIGYVDWEPIINGASEFVKEISDIVTFMRTIKEKWDEFYNDIIDNHPALKAAFEYALSTPLDKFVKGLEVAYAGWKKLDEMIKGSDLYKDKIILDSKDAAERAYGNYLKMEEAQKNLELGQSREWSDTSLYGTVDDADNYPHTAVGTNYWKGGLTHINENGGEIIDLPRGSRVIPADKSAAMVGDKHITININIGSYYGEDEEYLDRIGNEVATRLAEVM